MNDYIEKAINSLAILANDKNLTPDEALKFTQAALNLAHTLQVLKNYKE